jgi:hypothetical protein
MSTLERKENKMMEKLQVALSDIGTPFHNWKGVTWGREGSNQAMTELSILNEGGNPLDVWVEGTVNGEPTTMRFQDVSRVYVTVQGAIERDDMVEFFKMFASAIKLSAKMHIHDE